MATHVQPRARINWWRWGGAALIVLAAVAAAIYGFDLLGTGGGAVDTPAPVTQ